MPRSAAGLSPAPATASKRRARLYARISFPRRTPLTLRTESPTGLLKTRELLVITIVAQVLGNIALSRGMHHVGALVSASPLPYLRAALNPWVAAGVVILAIWMIAELALLSRADLSYVLPVTALSYVLIAIVGHFFLHDRISNIRWAGICLISVGVMVVGRTPTRTVPDIAEEEEAPEERRR